MSAVRIAGAQLTAPDWEALRDCVQQASTLPSRPGWERKASAYADTFRLLAEAAGDREPASWPGGAAGLVRDLLVAVGPAANGMIASSHRRLLAHLRAGDADRAARELAGHLAALHYMWRLTGAHSGRGITVTGKPMTGCPGCLADADSPHRCDAYSPASRRPWGHG